MYFKSRVEAGQKLGDLIAKKYEGQLCAVVGLSDGGVMVGAQIAMRLHSVLTLLQSESIMLPREPDAIAGINQDGSFSYNSAYSPGELEELVGEYHNFIEQEKMQKMQDLQHLRGHAGLIRKNLLRDHIVILASDGLNNGFSLDIAAEFLKPIHMKKLVVATPFASVKAVDRMHILADDIFCLSVIEDYISTDHYYDVQDVPPHAKVIKTIEQIVSHWQAG
ncbi:MAG TPA: phosphoribosyltransferase family protein [Candidatus Saccharimonadales bacterium]|jgi:predicted phosphoribosyltransferase|nr:phosphoribosyltransferase family protein [Candidatus Saccharimonadales bacterium]